EALGRPRLSGVVFAGVGSGIAVAGVLCLVLMHAGTSGATAWATLGTVALAATGLVWTRVTDTPRVVAAASSPPVSRPHRGGDALWLGACCGIFGFAYIAPATFLPAMAREVIRDPLVFGWSWPVFGLAAAVSTVAIGVVPARWSGRRQWAASQAVLA